MKKNIVLFLPLLVFCVLMACEPSPVPSGEHGEIVEHQYNQFSKEFWGEWIDISNEYKYYISNSTILSYGDRIYPNLDMDYTITLKKLSPNFIEMTQKYTDYDWEEKRTLIASRLPESSINGRVVENIALRSSFYGRAVSGLGGIDVVVSNLNNKANNQKTKTDNNGNFSADDIIIGDEYEIIVEDNVDNIIPNFNGDDIGNITITDGVRFKARAVEGYNPYFNNEDLAYLLADEEYGIGIEIWCSTPWIWNSSSYEGRTIGYEITLPDGITSNSKLSGSLVYLKGGNGGAGYNPRVIARINTFCEPISDEYEIKKIGVKIIDEDENKEYEDLVSVKIYRDQTNFLLCQEYSEDSFLSQCFIRNPNIITQNFRINSFDVNNAINHGSTSDYDFDLYLNFIYMWFIIPKYTGAEYLFVVSNSSNALYFATDSEFTPDFTGNIDSGSAYNNENNAKIMMPGDNILLNTNGEYAYFKLRF
jgi:hypothetical protein